MSEFIGLIPAAGFAKRLQNLSCSKEIYPIALPERGKQAQSFPVCQYLINAYRKANITNICVITREDKKDIANTLGNGDLFNIQLSYLYTGITNGPPYTLDKAYPLIKKKYVALGFPDILFKPGNAYSQLASKLNISRADVVLGLFPANNPQKMDMVEFNQNGKIHSIKVKPKNTTLKWTWILAIWKPSFSQFMHDTLIKLSVDFKLKKKNEIHVGDIFEIALKNNLIIDFVKFPKGELIDIGTPEDLNQVEKLLSKKDWKQELNF